ncbi:MAG: GNAT family N-acetyltransferase [Pseudomonadota bacterium]
MRSIAHTPLPEGYAVRQADIAEAPQLPDIEDRAGALFLESNHPEVNGHEAGSPQLFRAHINQNLCFLMVDASDTPIGFATCGVLDRTLHLYELAMVPEHGGKGLGKALIETVCAEAAARGLDAVTLSTFTDVAWNGPFYERVGFRTLDDVGLMVLYQVQTRR